MVPLVASGVVADGKWILFDSLEGLAIVSPDRRTHRVLSSDWWFAHEWTDDGQTIVGLESDEVRGHYMLARLDVATGRERVVAADLGAISPAATQPIRGLSPIGNGEFVTSIARPSSGIFALEGVGISRSGWDRVRSIVGRR